MKFTIFSHVDHCTYDYKLYAYAPYVREMNLWIENFDEVEVISHLSNRSISNIDMAYSHDNISLKSIKAFNLTSIKNFFLALAYLPRIIFIITKAMYSTDHIHIRCPGNIALLACFVQIFFPNKRKTAKYAGNWDPNAQPQQPWSYKLQKWILNNTFLTKNIQVLVYGEWKRMSKNISPFFTATYSEEEAIYANSLPEKYLPNQVIEPIRFMYVGTLSPGKRPLYALQIFQDILKQFPNSTLEIYGEGIMRKEVEVFIAENRLQNNVILHGNQAKEIVEKAYQNNHFLILASQSEGWPKVVAEAMFWGCVPLSTNVSCVYQMMGLGSRGVLLDVDLAEDVIKIINLISNPMEYNQMSKLAKKWSTQYTMDKFKREIKKIIA